MQSSDHLLACPRCEGGLRALRCEACALQYDAPGGIAALRIPGDPRTEAVRQFYAEAPFPGYPPRDSLSGLRARAARSEFARLAKEDRRIDRAFTAFLAQAYALKEIADYGVGPDAGVTIAEAKQAIETAERFVDCIWDLISPQRPTPSRDNGAKS